MECRGCGGQLPPYQGRGQPRKYCQRCRPSKAKKPASPALRVVADGERRPEPETLVDVVRRELRAAGRLDTSDGMALVMLAERMELARGEPGTALATLTKQFHETKSVVLADAGEEADELDLLLADA